MYTGDGAGKTTASLGLAMRSLGWGKKVTIIQFMKGWKNTGEVRIASKLKPKYEIHQFGRVGWVNVYKPDKADIELAQKGLEFARKALKKAPDLLILDEINLAAGAGLLKINDVLDLLKKIPAKTTVVLTGRWAPKRFIDRADFANELKPIKMPKRVPAIKGLQY